MGTQFSSRIKGLSGERLRSTIGTLAGDPKLGRAGLGKRVLDQTLAEASSHHLFQEFGSSKLFVQVLHWLKELHSDAQFHGFVNKAREYKLAESSNSIAALSGALNELLNASPERRNDPFRVAARDAAVSVLAAAATKPSDAGEGFVPGQRFGSQLRKMDTKELVEIYVKSFVSNLVSSMLHSADPNATSISPKALTAAEGAAARLGKSVVSDVEGRALLADDEKIRETLLEALRSHAQTGENAPD